MAAGDTTITQFAAQNVAVGKTNIEALGITGTDLVLHWQKDGQVFVARIELV